MTAEEAYFSDNSKYGAYGELTSGNYDFTLSPGNEAGASTGTDGGYSLEVTNNTISKGIKTCSIKAGTEAGTPPDPAVDGVIICS
jgi:hypothetical protein